MIISLRKGLGSSVERQVSIRSVETCWQLERTTAIKQQTEQGYERVSVAFENVTCVRMWLYNEREERRKK
jgi:hypothetical protein